MSYVDANFCSYQRRGDLLLLPSYDYKKDCLGSWTTTGMVTTGLPMLKSVTSMEFRYVRKNRDVASYIQY